MAALSFGVALYLRIGEDMLDYEPRYTLAYGVGFTAIAAVVFLFTGLYRGIWRYASLPDLFNIARAATLTVLIFLPVMFLFTRLETLPRSTLFINWLVLIALLGAPRLAYRLFKDRGLDHILERDSGPRRAGAADQRPRGRRHLHPRDRARPQRRSIASSASSRDTPSRVGREIYGVPVLGTIDGLEARGRAARPPRPAPAAADHHRAGPRRRGDPATCSTAPTRWRSRWRGCRGSTELRQQHLDDADAGDRADRDRGSARPAAGGARPRRRWRG